MVVAAATHTRTKKKTKALRYHNYQAFDGVEIWHLHCLVLMVGTKVFLCCTREY